ncbi:hypothetical protein OPV22_024415 [Ensete ventricosum]|uniref:Uncharacterized protein n=1 Tax=Ensete ventricosum TaxID=4639 RepID=A0AAV8QEU9_ENSVE|nr:hypothetical protein OPV22_024415 [Ensete ventricosum]
MEEKGDQGNRRSTFRLLSFGFYHSNLLKFHRRIFWRKPYINCQKLRPNLRYHFNVIVQASCFNHAYDASSR